jgi:hypothetical protein
MPAWSAPLHEIDHTLLSSTDQSFHTGEYLRGCERFGQACMKLAARTLGCKADKAICKDGNVVDTVRGWVYDQIIHTYQVSVIVRVHEFTYPHGAFGGLLKL